MKDPHEADFQEANSRLFAGLKSCRSVVENYRVMLTGETGDEQANVRSADSGDEPGSSEALTP